MAKKAAKGGKSSAPARTAKQEQSFRKVLDGQLAHERNDKTHSIKLAFQRGNVSQRVLSKQTRNRFGVCTVDEIAEHIGVSRLTVQQSMKLAKMLPRTTLDELCKLEKPPSWRMMAQWVGIKDDKRRASVLRDILSGKITSDGFDAKLRSAVGSGPKRSRRPVGGAATLRKIGAEAVTFVEHLGWATRATGEIRKMKDETAKREAKAVMRDTLKQLKAAQRDLVKTIKDCEKLA